MLFLCFDIKNMSVYCVPSNVLCTQTVVSQNQTYENVADQVFIKNKFLGYIYNIYFNKIFIFIRHLILVLLSCMSL